MQTARSWLRARSWRGGKDASGRAKRRPGGAQSHLDTVSCFRSRPRTVQGRAQRAAPSCCLCLWHQWPQWVLGVSHTAPHLCMAQATTTNVKRIRRPLVVVALCAPGAASSEGSQKRPGPAQQKNSVMHLRSTRQRLLPTRQRLPNSTKRSPSQSFTPIRPMVQLPRKTHRKTEPNARDAGSVWQTGSRNT